MMQDQRDTQPPIPVNASEYLTVPQRISLSRIKTCGWHLAFIRRNEKEKSLPFISSASGYQMGIIEADGHINLTSAIKTRPDCDSGMRSKIKTITQLTPPTSIN